MRDRDRNSGDQYLPAGNEPELKERAHGAAGKEAKRIKGVKGYSVMEKRKSKDGKPFIHLFNTKMGNYLFDVNKNQFVKISESVYDYLSNACSEAIEKEIENCIDDLKEKGFLKDNHPQKTEHPVNEYYGFLMNNNLFY